MYYVAKNYINLDVLQNIAKIKCTEFQNWIFIENNFHVDEEIFKF